MNLIDEKVIIEAAKEYALVKNDEHEITFMLSKSDFKAGCKFAQQQLQPFIIDFVEFCSSIERNSLTGLYWFNLKHLTTQQLLEEFVEIKNKQK